MKKTLFKLTTLAGLLFFSFTGSAQEKRLTAASPKPPEVIGKQLQPDKTSNVEPTVSPAVVDAKTLHNTATKQSSFTGPKPVKGEDLPPSKTPEKIKPADTLKPVPKQ